MALGQASFTSKVTQESEMLTFWVVHFGDHNVAGGVVKEDAGGTYQDMLASISGAFERVDIPEVVRLLDRRFGEKTYSLRSLFRDEQRRIVRTILSTTVAEAEAAYLQLYDRHAALMRFITTLGTPMPREFTAAVEYAINSLLRRACAKEDLDGERIHNLLREAQASNLTLDKTTLEFLLRQKVDTLAGRFAADPSNLSKLIELHKCSDDRQANAISGESVVGTEPCLRHSGPALSARPAARAARRCEGANLAGSLCELVGVAEFAIALRH